MRRNNGDFLGSIIWFLIIASILISIFGYLIPIICAGIVIFFIAYAIAKGSNSNSKQSTVSYAKTKIDDSGILELLKEIDGNKIQINSDIYLFLSNPDNINLETIQIFLNDECIGNLNEFSKQQPKSFNKLCKNLAKKLDKQSKSDNAKDKITESILVEKNCTYYINKLTNVNKQIEVEEVNKLVNESIEHLKEIKRIEDEFGVKQDKTRKLYDYYLPMYLEILVNYDRLHDNAPQSDEYKKSEENVLKTGSMINNALSNLSNSLVETYRTNLNVDMKTLESILKKDGLIDEIKDTKVE